MLLALVATWLPCGVRAEDNSLETADQQLRDIKVEVERGAITGDRYDAIEKDIGRIQRQAQACIDETGQQSEKAAHDLASLGAAVAGEDPTVTGRAATWRRTRARSRRS